MRFLFFKANLYMQDDWMNALVGAGYTIDPVTYIFTSDTEDHFFSKKFKKRLDKVSYDAVLSLTFFPILSDICKEYKIPYISWQYDSPIPNFTRFDTPYNHIFHFDKLETEEYRAKGYTQIEHLPLAVNVPRLDSQLSPLDQMPAYQYDISFVGNLYTNRSIASRNFVSSKYAQGVLEGYAAAQTLFYGTDLARELIEHSPFFSRESLPEDFPWKYLMRSVHEEATHQERTHTLKKLAKYFDVDLFTAENTEAAGLLHVHPAIGYYTEMPRVFRHSRINLNINYRTIRSGMSARILDIIGSGGFLMSTPQPELLEYFKEDTDFVAFRSADDLLDKCSYYLEHEKERHQIAKNGYEKAKKYHTYEARFKELFSFLEKKEQ